MLRIWLCALLLLFATQLVAQQYLVLRKSTNGKRIRYDVGERIHLKTNEGKVKGEITLIVDILLPKANENVPNKYGSKIPTGYIEVEGKRVYLKDIKYIKQDKLRRYGRFFSLNFIGVVAQFALIDLARNGSVSKDTQKQMLVWGGTGGLLWLIPAPKRKMGKKWKPTVVTTGRR